MPVSLRARPRITDFKRADPFMEFPVSIEDARIAAIICATLFSVNLFGALAIAEINSLKDGSSATFYERRGSGLGRSW